MFPIPRAKIGPSVTAQYGDEDVSDRGLDDISLREDDLHSVNLGSEVIPGSRPAWMTMLDKPDFKKLHLDPFSKKSISHFPPPTLPGTVGGTKACESALRSAGTLLSRVQVPPSAPQPDGGP
ncbi:cathepsin d [Plakobranchus ocellatus]|uniref:Cathepsin d n=1 Tax=Plakobranchus ocellatus TaxID=259542 RepID=A0AAV3XUU1_9GAST|nr:cathepsin d [Plakobranchus ocellatus]